MIRKIGSIIVFAAFAGAAFAQPEVMAWGNLTGMRVDAEIYADGSNAAAQPKDSVLEKRRVNAQTVLKLKLAPGGGSAIRLVPVR